MPNKFSIVIICRNAAEGIDRTLTSTRELSDDVVVYDSGSTDGTAELVASLGIPVHKGPWLGFGPTRRAATFLAKYDWVFCIDADEWLGSTLTEELLELEPVPGTAYRVRVRNHLGKRVIHWGAWGKDYRVRLFNRNECNWSDAQIHEKVVPLRPVTYRTFNGSIVHRTARSLKDYRRKLAAYARLTAKSYHARGRRASLVKQLLSPVVTFLKNYFWKLGVLEGAVGLKLAWAEAGYTRRKYQELSLLNRRQKK